MIVENRINQVDDEAPKHFGRNGFEPIQGQGQGGSTNNQHLPFFVGKGGSGATLHHKPKSVRNPGASTSASSWVSHSPSSVRAPIKDK